MHSAIGVSLSFARALTYVACSASVSRHRVGTRFNLQQRHYSLHRKLQRGIIAAADSDGDSPATSPAADFTAAPQLQPEQTPDCEGVYAVYAPDGSLQFVGLSRRIKVSVSVHKDALPELVGSVKVWELPGGTKEQLTAAWKVWIQAAVQELQGQVPPGNMQGETKWQQRRRPPARPDIRLTPGKGLQDLTCTVEDLIDQVVKSCRAVVFIKGSRTQPQCGFSHRVLTMLQETGADYEVVNVLDEVYNPGVREAIKSYTDWPTIPQIFIGGEFVGGADIVEQMHGSGELRGMLERAGALSK